MRVFVAGATGVAGKRAVVRLVAAGHQVTGIARTPEKDAQLEALGATPVRVSLFDAEGLRTAVAGHDAVVSLATHIPPMRQMAQPKAWAENEQIRTQGSTNLVDAAIAGGATVFVQESLAFLYGEHGDAWVDAETTSWKPSLWTGAMQTAEDNLARFTDHGGRGIALRFGRFYAHDSDQAATTVAFARHGVALELGHGDGYVPWIDADDVASAVVAALDAPAGVYDVVDDEPLTRREQGHALAAAVGRKRLWAPPKWAAPKTAAHLAASQRVSNARFRAATNWRPSSPSVREGFAKLVRELHVEPALTGWTRLMLWILTFSAFGVGIQAAFFPRSFYDDFPMGRGWVAMDGPYNEHIIRDVGVLNLALLVLTIGALIVGTRAIAKLTAVAWLVYSVPHFVYHARHLTMDMPGAEKVVLLGSLAVPVLAALVILFERRSVQSGRARAPGRTAATVRDDDLRRDVGAGGRDGIDQSRAGVS
jgi:nucleoside-diphosphate-sugar epimerase